MDNKNYDCPYIISPFYQTLKKKKVVFQLVLNLSINLKSINLETIESKKKRQFSLQSFPQ